MLDLSSSMAWNCKLDRPGVAWMLISGGIHTRFIYNKVIDKKRSAAAILHFTLKWPYGTDCAKKPRGNVKRHVTNNLDE